MSTATCMHVHARIMLEYFLEAKQPEHHPAHSCPSALPADQMVMSDQIKTSPLEQGIQKSYPEPSIFSLASTAFCHISDWNTVMHSTHYPNDILHTI